MYYSERHNQMIEALRKTAKETLPEGSVVRLFGSRARGDAHSDSDWDIHILVPSPERLPWSQISHYTEPFYNLELEYNEIINIIVHSFAGWEKRWFMPLHNNIEKEGILL